MPRGPKPWYRKREGTWYARVNGRQVSLLVRGRRNEAEAWEAWHRLRRGTPAAVQPVIDVPPTVSELVKSFLADAATHSRPKTVEVYTFFLDCLVGAYGGKAASSVASHEVEAMARRPEWSPSTRNGFVGTVATLFRWATRTKRLTTNPIADVKRPTKTSRGARAVLTRVQTERLIAASSPAFATLLKLLWLTGARPCEIATATARDVHFDSQLIVLATHKTAEATGRPRVIHLPTEAVDILRRLVEKYRDGPLVRNSRGGAWTGWAMVKAMQAAREKAGVPNAIVYGLRHSLATDALAAGVPDPLVAELLGHVGTRQLFLHYAHLGAKSRVLRDALSTVR